MAANFAADFERPPRRPILDRYLVTSEGTHSTYRKPLSSSSCALTPEIFASYSLQIRWLRIEGERRITQRLAAVDASGWELQLACVKEELEKKAASQ
jgi:hypothetical protein